MEDEFDIEEVVEEDALFEHLRLVADAGQTPLRVDKFLLEHTQHSSRNRIQQAAEAGFIHVRTAEDCELGRESHAVKCSYKVRPGDVVTLMLRQPKHDTTIYPEEIPLDIVYEDEVLMVVNKRAGMVVHPGAGNFNGTLINAVAWHMRDVPEFDANSPEVGLVHRIDKDTSGLVVIAKTPEAKTNLGGQFFRHDTRRTYNCLVWGHFTEDEGTITGNIARDPRDRQRMTVTAPDSGVGKPAVTHWRVLEKYGYTTLVECRLETGRTHQIRAHMKHIGHPLFGDERYGGTEILRGERTAKYKAFINNCFAVCNRQALHAKTLGFAHPLTGAPMDFDSEWPEDFRGLVEKWRGRFSN